MQPSFERSHYLDGFGYPDRKFHFRVDWTKVPNTNIGAIGPWQDLPDLPDHWTSIEQPTDAYPFRLATSPARSFLNSTFTETPSSRGRPGRMSAT